MSLPPSSPPIVDALERWAPQPEQMSPPLKVIRLDANACCVVPFTTAIAEVQIHYLDYPSLRGYYHCTGSDCVLCQIGRYAEGRDLLPVYNPVARSVEVIAISHNVRPRALRPQIRPALEALRNNHRVLVTIRRPETAAYEVTITDLPAHADDGAAVIRRFYDQCETGRIDLRTVYPTISNDELAQVPEIASLLRLRGITA